MLVKIKRKNYRVFAFDVESHNDDESIAKKETSIWLYSFIDEFSKIDDERSYGYTIEQFLTRLEEESRLRKDGKKQCGNLYVAVYNLSFEWSFLLPVLLKNGFEWTEDIEHCIKPSYCSITNKSCSSVWEAAISFGAKHGVIVFRDIAKLYGGGLRNVAKSLGLETQKGDIDYKLNRLHDYKVTKEEKDYCFKDTRILIEICQKMIERGDSLFFNSLSSASYAIRNMIQAGWPNSLKPYKKYRARYPRLNETEDTFLRHATHGGISYIVPNYQFKPLGKLLHIDMHQAHPTSAYLNFFPKGEGLYFKGEPPRGYISCCHIRFSFDAVKLHSQIPLIGKLWGDQEELWVWSVEIGTMLKCYVNPKIEYIDGYAYEFARLPWRKFYNDNFNARLEAKKAGRSLDVARYKLLNNSSYGKLLEHAHTCAFENIIGTDFALTSVEHTREVELDEGKYTYLPIGSLIPAYTRVRLIETALLFGWENIVYFDTDSIFMLDTLETRKVLKTINLKDELGGWGIEKDIVKGQFAAPKRYKIIEVDEQAEEVPVYHLAGFNGFDGKDFEEVNIVSAKYQVKGTLKVKGGTIVVLKDKEVSVQPKYRDIYESAIRA